jgi:anti-sigma regulatory factor (Ser/Thr protein kinase)
VREELDHLEEIESVLPEAKLVASELVSNAVLHSGCTSNQVIEVHGRVGRDLFEISVHDPGLSDETPKVQDDPDTSGRGLAIVEQLSHRWGMEHPPDGRLVWAQVLTLT